MTPEHNVRVVLEYPSGTRKILLAVVYRRGDFYASLGHKRLAWMHVSYHRSGRRKFTPEPTRLDMLMDEATDAIHLFNDFFAFAGFVGNESEWNGYESHRKHNHVVRIETGKFGPYIQVMAELVEPREPPVLPLLSNPFSPSDSLLIHTTKPWLYLSWEHIPDGFIGASQDFKAESIYFTVNAMFGHELLNPPGKEGHETGPAPTPRGRVG